MRVHTNLSRDQVVACVPAGVTIHHMSEHGSRSRPRAFNVVLEGSSIYGGQFGNQDYSAGTWDEWGIFLGALFALDPAAHVGKTYLDADHFHWVTGDRYRAEAGLTVANQHKRHNWDYKGVAVTGSYLVHECRCGAIMRRMSQSRSFDEIR